MKLGAFEFNFDFICYSMYPAYLTKISRTDLQLAEIKYNYIIAARSVSVHHTDHLRYLANEQT